MGLRALKTQLRKAGYPKAAAGLERIGTVTPGIPVSRCDGVRISVNEHGNHYAMAETATSLTPICDEHHVYNPRPVGGPGRPRLSPRKRVALSLRPELVDRIVALIGDEPVATWVERCVIDCLEAAEAP
jgi:hypothetical protein